MILKNALSTFESYIHKCLTGSRITAFIAYVDYISCFRKKKSKSSFETRLKNCYRGENIEEQNQNQAQVFSNIWGIESHLNMYTDQNLIIQKL